MYRFTHWIPMLSLDPDTAESLARQALPRYGLAADAAMRLVKQRENFVFALFDHADDEAPRHIIRVHRQGYHTDEELTVELDYVHALRDAGVSVPSFIPSDNGDTFCIVGEHTEAGAHQVDVQHFIANHGNFGDEHTAFDGTATLPKEDLYRIGKLIAEVHNATEASGFELTVDRDAWDCDGLVGSHAVWGDPLRLAEITPERMAILEAAIAKIRAVLTEYGQADNRYGPIHADLTPENILRTHNGFVLIDFDDFAQGWHLFDLATAIFFFTPHPRFDAYHEALFAGYESQRPLDAADHAAFPAILLARALTYLGWSADRRGEPTAEFHAEHVLPHIVDMARRFVQQPG